MPSATAKPKTKHASEQPVARWKYINPLLSEQVYRYLEEPTSLSDAHRRMVMHRSTVEDIEIQIKIAEANHSIYLTSEMDEESDKVFDSERYANKTVQHLERIVVLLNTMLIHKRRASAYWYWLQCHEDNLSHLDDDQPPATSNR